MSNISRKRSDLLFRRSFFFNESCILFLKCFIYDRTFPLFLRYYLFFRLNVLIRRSNSFRTKIHNRCLLTGRSRGVYRFFKMCRFSIRFYSYHKQLQNIYTRNW